MKKNNKTYQKALNAAQNLRFTDFQKLVEGLGFTLRKKKGGSHRVYTRPDVKEIVTIQADKHNMAKEYQVNQVLDIIDDYDLLED